MRKNIFKIFAVMMVLAMVLPVTAFGQGGNGIAQTPARPDGFTPEDLVPVGEGPAGSVVDLSPDENGMSNYIVTFRDPAIASYTGGIEGIPATSPAVTGESKLNTRAPSVESYKTYLEAQQLTAISQAEQLIGRSVDVKYQFQHALNAAVFKMTAAEAASVAQMDGVLRVEKDVAYPVNTDVSPDWIGVSELWEGSGTGLPVTKGEGIIVGLVDTGINMDHPSFAETDDFGYTHTNPYGSGYFLGWCNQDNPNFKGHYACNDKLIGAWDYADASWAGTDDEENDGPEDSDGHGSHTASTSAGNTILAASLVAPTTAITDTISGMAPHANIIAYDVCAVSCYTSDSVAAVNQAILDGVDVINESISLGGDSFEGAKQQAYFGATLSGIFIARSAGNEGPGSATVGPEPPWTLSTAALTHNRTMFNYLTDMTGGENPPADIQGVGFTAGYGPAEIVYAGWYTSTETTTPELCGVGEIEDYDSPWPPGTFDGEIVVCDRGTFGRVEKGANVLAAGAGGYVLVDNGGGLVSDPHELPGIHISVEDGAVLKSWLSLSETQMATISGYVLDYSESNGDIMAGFSSRGPAPVDVLKPDAGAPGVAIWAAYRTPIEYTFLGGTSMASPHVAGSAALLKSLYPDWTPTQIKSALMGTATTENTLKEDSETATTPFDVGAGRIQPAIAAQTGLVMDITIAEYDAANPNDGGDPKELNMPSMADSACYQECSWERTVQSTKGMAVNWTASVEGDPGLVLTVSPSEFEIGQQGTADLVVHADVKAAMPESWVFGTVTLTPDDDDIPAFHMPVAVYVSASTNPDTAIKVVDEPTVAVHGTSSYTVTISNSNTITSTFYLTDTLPANAVYVPMSGSEGVSYITDTNTLTWSGEVGPSGMELISYSPIFGTYIPLSDYFSPFGFPSGGEDDGCWGINVPSFDYMGQTYSYVIMSMNGTLEVGGASLSCTGGANHMVPEADGINNLLAPWWTDLNFTNSGEIYVGVLNTGYGQFTIYEWEDAPHFDNEADTANFQIWIRNGGEEIWYAYPTDWISGTVHNATIGFEDASGTAGATYYYNGAGTVPTGNEELVVTITTSPPAVVNYDLMNTGGEYVLNEVDVTDGLDLVEAWAYAEIMPNDIYLPIIAK